MASFTDDVPSCLSVVSSDAVTFVHAVHAASQLSTVTFTVVSTPIGTLFLRLGTLNVVEPSHTPYKVDITENNEEYVVRETAVPSHNKYHVGADAVDHIEILPVGSPHHVISDVIATVPSLSGKVYVRATVLELVSHEIIVPATFFIFSLNRVRPEYPPLASLLFEFSATYPILFSVIDQLPAVFPGVSTRARITSPMVTATHQRVPHTEIVHRSHFNIAHDVPLHPEEGNTFPEAL